MGLFSKLKDAMSFKFHVLESAPALTPQQQRGLALGLPYAVEGVLPINALTMEADAQTAQKVVRGPWGAVDPASARENYTYLLTGGHDQLYRIVTAAMNQVDRNVKRKEMVEQYERAQAGGRAAAAAVGISADRFDDAFKGWFGANHFALPSCLPDTAKATVPTTIVAWDAARVVHCSRLFVDAGFIAPDEAWSAIQAAVDLARPHYRSWAEFNDGFLIGRYYWDTALQKQNVTAASDDLRKFALWTDEMLTMPDSPWVLNPW